MTIAPSDRRCLPGPAVQKETGLSYKQLANLRRKDNTLVAERPNSRVIVYRLWRVKMAIERYGVEVDAS